ncbi:MAG: OmpH family outer membrane protein [Rhodobacterales bacterium]
MNDMNTRRRKLLDVENEYSYFRTSNGLQYRTAKTVTSLELFLRVLVIVTMLVSETYFNGTYLAKGSTQGLIGGVFEALTFAALNIGFSVVLTLYVIKQIVRQGLFWKLLGLIGIGAWIAVVLVINLALAHYREVASTFVDGAGADILQNILQNPLGLNDFESWMLFAIGVLFAVITLVDVITFSDIYPGYTKRQARWDEEQSEYKEQFDDLIEDLNEIKEDYQEQLSEIGAALSARQRELDNILSNRNRLSNLYAAHHEQLQRAANSLFSFYYESNKKSRTEQAPDRFNKRYLVPEMALSTGASFEPREAQKIKSRINQAKQILDDQIKVVLDEYSNGIRQYRNLDILNEEYSHGQETQNAKQAETI